MEYLNGGMFRSYEVFKFSEVIDNISQTMRARIMLNDAAPADIDLQTQFDTSLLWHSLIKLILSRARDYCYIQGSRDPGYVFRIGLLSA